jgi:hypothetical protein
MPACRNVEDLVAAASGRKGGETPAWFAFLDPIFLATDQKQKQAIPIRACGP